MAFLLPLFKLLKMTPFSLLFLGDPVYIYVSLGFLSISHVTEENMVTRLL